MFDIDAKSETWPRSLDHMGAGLRAFLLPCRIRGPPADHGKPCHNGATGYQVTRFSTSMRKSPLHIDQILAWADAFHKVHGRWPTDKDGKIAGANGESWTNVGQALQKGLRCLPAGLSLARLLAQHRGKRNRKALPPYSASEILKWADAYYEQTSSWPSSSSGPIRAAPGETWMAVEMALGKGLRGLPGGSSLSKLLARKRGVRNEKNLPRLSIEQILIWADEHHRRTGNWPTAESGPILDGNGERWLAVDVALRQGHRGLRGGSSISRLLAKRRGVGRHVRKSPLTIRQILAWADSYHDRTGQWPKVDSGPIPNSDGETWRTIQAALREGRRGLGERTSLAKMFAQHRGVRNAQNLPPLSEEQILDWVREYVKKNGCRPTRNSGIISGTGGTTWCGVEVALKKGHRGLSGGQSLSKLISASIAGPARRGIHAAHARLSASG